MSKLFVYTIILLIFPDVISGNTTSHFENIDPPQKVIHLPVDHFNYPQALLQAQEELAELHKTGFLDASIDSVLEGGELLTVYITTGSQYYYVTQNFLFPPPETTNTNVASVFGNEPLSFTEFENRSRKILFEYSRKGFPFARIEKRNIQVKDFNIYMDIAVDRGEPAFFDTLRIIGNAWLRNQFLENYLGIKAGARYDEKLVMEASEKLGELTFISLTGPTELLFSPGLATIFIPAQNKKVNRFDGMAGLTGGGENEIPVQINGILGLYLSNTLGMGEVLNLSWHGPGGGTQILNIHGGYPFPLGLPLETEATFSLHKQDTSWLQLQFRPAIYFKIQGPIQFGSFWHYRVNNTIANSQSNSTISSQTGAVDFKSNMYGIELKYVSRGYLSNLLQSGVFAKINTSVGAREIKLRSNLIPSEQSMQQKKSQLNAEAVLEKRWVTGSRTTFSIKSDFALLGGDKLPNNQLYRLGGFSTLKGFDELSIHASAYAFTNIELRLFTAEQSYFSLFANGGWFERKAIDQYFNDLPVGTGIGLNLQTQAGIFSMILAIGTSKTMPTEFRNAKIHLGYVSNF